MKLKPDLVAGLTLAAYLLPAGIGDASLAGLPAETGLYACLFSGLVFWIFCSSRHTVITVTSALSLLVGASIGELAAGDPARHAALASAMALMVAVIAIGAWMVRAGNVVGFFSETVLVGFKAGLALYLAGTQLPKLFGFSGSHGDFWNMAGHFLTHLGETNPTALIVGGSALAALVAGKLWVKNRPVSFFVVVAGIVAARMFHLEAAGVKLLGEIPQGLPLPSLPHVARADLNALLPAVLAAFVLGAVETSAIGRMFAQKHGYRLDPNRELLAVGMGNLASGLGHGFAVSGGMSQSLVNESAGAQSSRSGLVAALFTLFVVLFASGLLRNLPQPVLGAIVLAAVMSLFDVKALRRIWHFSRAEFFIAMAALLGVLGSGPANGVLLGAGLSIVMLLRQASRPRVVELGRVPGTTVFADLSRDPQFQRLDNILVVRCESALIYFNVEYVRERVMQLLSARPDGIQLVVLYLGLVPKIDMAGAELIEDLHKTLETRGISLRLSDAHGEVRDALRRAGFEHVYGALGSDQTIEGVTRAWKKAATTLCLLAAVLLPAKALAQAEKDPEAASNPPFAVTIEGQPILWITVGAPGFSTEFRATRISQRIEAIVHDRTIRDPQVAVTDIENASELRVNGQLVMVVTARDAASLGAPRATVAQNYARIIEESIRTERLRYAPATLIRSAALTTAATLIFATAAWLVVRVTSASRRRLARRVARRAEKLRAVQGEVVSKARLARAIAWSLAALRAVVLIVALDLYLTYVLSLFPWTRAVSLTLGHYAVAPFRALGLAFVGYLPKLLFLVVIVAGVTLAIRVVSALFRLIETGRLVFAGFPAEWASPTNKIARVLLIAFGLVVAFPYLPASDSPAFTGVSVFVGVLVSLASSSALSNMIAGIVLTYTGAFRLGDRVKVGDAYGDIIDTSLLATRVRTIKNEEVTIPNSIALSTAVINYTREAQTNGLILHTTVTIGYDAPWRKIHELLIEAARATPGILTEPKPFVWQTALNDFYVTYEINAYTASVKDMIDIYAELHSRIQDAFFAAGVEIMSPHYTSMRDGNTIAIPPASRPADYQPQGFKVNIGGSLIPNP